jgi:hypothetical protein
MRLVAFMRVFHNQSTVRTPRFPQRHLTGRDATFRSGTGWASPAPARARPHSLSALGVTVNAAVRPRAPPGPPG